MLKSRNIIFGRFLLKLIDLSCFGQSLIFKLIYLTLSVPRGVLHSHGSIGHHRGPGTLEAYTFEVIFGKFKSESDLSHSVVATWWQAEKPNLVPLKAQCCSC